MYKYLIPLFIFIRTASAILPEYVYRVDTRSPAEIVTNGGFNSLGSNTNMIQHIGRQDQQNLSAFVATTADFARVQNIARALVRFNPSYQGHPLWVYRVRTTSNFYGAATTLEYIADRNNDAEIRRQAANLIPVAISQDEWVSAGNIPLRQIEYGQEINVEGNIVNISNQHQRFSQYNPDNTTANYLPYTGDFVQRIRNFAFAAMRRYSALVPVMFCIGKGRRISSDEVDCGGNLVVYRDPNEVIHDYDLFFNFKNSNLGLNAAIGLLFDDED